MNNRLHLKREWIFGDAISCWYVQRSNNEVFVAEPLILKKRDQEILGPVNPTFQLEVEEAQGLMDELWNIGFRPTEGTGSAGSLAATQRHLDDFRCIVSRQLGVELKP